MTIEQVVSKDYTEIKKSLNTPSGESYQPPRPEVRSWVNWLLLVAMVYLLVSAVSIISVGFKSAVGESAETLFQLVSNPFTGLFVGILATALVQSSSTVTSIIVGLVAGGLPVTLAVPMVMGANIGTSVTNTLVSIGHVTNAVEFRRAFAAASVLDMFNLIAVMIFLPLELLFQPLESISLFLAQSMQAGSGIDPGRFNVMDWLISPLRQATFFYDLYFSPIMAGVMRIITGVLLIFVSIYCISKLLKRLMLYRAKDLLKTAIGRGPAMGIVSGTIATVMFQSSSTTTSLMVPLAANGILSLKEIYPFTLGANIGTCITALLAASAITGASAVSALEIALVHFLFNVFGVAIIFGLPFLRNVPIQAAQGLAEIASRRPVWAITYVAGTFFLLPGALIGLPLLW